MPPPTPLLHQLWAEVDAYMQWWVQTSWWHTSIVVFLAWVMATAFFGGLAGFFTRSPDRKPEELSGEQYRKFQERTKA